jgi:hypothetical protein
MAGNAPLLRWACPGNQSRWRPVKAQALIAAIGVADRRNQRGYAVTSLRAKVIDAAAIATTM